MRRDEFHSGRKFNVSIIHWCIIKMSVIRNNKYHYILNKYEEDEKGI